MARTIAQQMCVYRHVDGCITCRLQDDWREPLKQELGAVKIIKYGFKTKQVLLPAGTRTFRLQRVKIFYTPFCYSVEVLMPEFLCQYSHIPVPVASFALFLKEHCGFAQAMDKSGLTARLERALLGENLSIAVVEKLEQRPLHLLANKGKMLRLKKRSESIMRLAEKLTSACTEIELGKVEERFYLHRLTPGSHGCITNIFPLLRS